MSASKPRLKARPVITFADFRKAAGPHVGDAPIPVFCLRDGIVRCFKLRGTEFGMFCPACGELCLDLYPHPADRGVICVPCLGRCEVVEP